MRSSIGDEDSPAELDPEELKALFRKYGTDEEKARLSFDLGR